MTTKEFLNRYDKKKFLSEQELEDLWWGDLIDGDYIPVVQSEQYGTPSRWQIPVDKVIQVEDRYFMIYRFQAATEYQETTYDWQPDEVYPVKRTITCWEGVPENCSEENINN
jgi:hypothetical protein